jgi:hypothetical protein
MVRRVAFLLLLGSSCNWAFDIEDTELMPSTGGGTDLDLDSIPDDEDPCIAAMQDETDDYDRDELLTATDPCPFDPATSQNGNPDTDGDGVNDACDPFPTTSGDSRRCTMRFYNTDLNARLWKETSSTMVWSSSPGSLYANEDSLPSNLASTLDLEQVAEPTFDVTLFTSGDPFSTHGVRVWARAADPASRDVGTPMMLTGTPFPLASSLRIQLTLEPATGAIRCTVSRPPDRWVVTATAPLGAGHLGFGAEGAQVQVTGVAIYDRTTILPLP